MGKRLLVAVLLLVFAASRGIAPERIAPAIRHLQARAP